MRTDEDVDMDIYAYNCVKIERCSNENTPDDEYRIKQAVSIFPIQAQVQLQLQVQLPLFIM
jgi:hypothetical protein